MRGICLAEGTISLSQRSRVHGVSMYGRILLSSNSHKKKQTTWCKSILVDGNLDVTMTAGGGGGDTLTIN
jgi:hypothetical protein